MNVHSLGWIGKRRWAAREGKVINFKSTPADAAIIRKLAIRARALETEHGGQARDQMDWVMDFTATHLNGNPLDLEKLLKADDFNFMHAAFGICRHLDRETGALGDFFSPRCSLPEAVAA